MNPKVAGKVRRVKQTNLSGGLGSSHSLGNFSKGSSQSSSKDNGAETTNEEALQMQTELKGKVVEMARQQFGSKQLQKLLAKASPDFVGFAIEESLYHLHELMAD